MEKLVHIPAVTKLTPLVSRFLGMNPGKFSLQGTNTYLIGQGPRRLLIDTGEGADEYTETVSNYLKENNIELDTIILSHWHADHTKGTVPLLKKLKDKKVQTSPLKWSSTRFLRWTKRRTSTRAGPWTSIWTTVR